MAALVCSVPILGALLALCGPEAPTAIGYVEGDHVRIAPIEPARIEEVAVRRGDRVSVGQRIATLERRDAEIALRQAEAAVAAARSRVEDLKQGARPEEIQRLEAQIRSARARVDQLERERARQEALFARGDVSAARLEEIETELEVARAGVAELEASLAVARLPARADQIEAAEAALEEAIAARDAAAWRLSQRVLVAERAGVVADILRHAGELGGPDAPVVSVLPDGAVRLVFFVRQDLLPRLALGQDLDFTCDGCPSQAKATISYIASGPEFTPPVIYSRKERQKLVFRIEARPVADFGLKPGQIVDVQLHDGGHGSD
ncbi:MAG: biotin/lipoyl-binding protein [Alphaproteobacteria bacterium]|nr:MAG: biotin/lipoyl-binding protein [Alphaproteobacteria bacterium]